MDANVIAQKVRDAKLVLWDFDGVIKESVAVKTQAFAALFGPFGSRVVAEVTRHHEANGGMSRFEKIPLYLELAGELPTEARVNEMCDRFATLVRDAVIAAPWVPGAERYLRSRPRGQTFALVSATPREELLTIIEALRLRECFHEIFGAPTSKEEAVRPALLETATAPAESVMIGDSSSDLEAARRNQVPFVLRRHESNGGVFEQYSGPWLDDLSAL
jgi:phosphoglycolate phosphatase-like HAD superfamily hydrolase